MITKGIALSVHGAALSVVADRLSLDAFKNLYLALSNRNLAQSAFCEAKKDSRKILLE